MFVSFPVRHSDELRPLRRRRRRALLASEGLTKERWGEAESWFVPAQRVWCVAGPGPVFPKTCTCSICRGLMDLLWRSGVRWSARTVRRFAEAHEPATRHDHDTEFGRPHLAAHPGFGRGRGRGGCIAEDR